MRRSSGMKGRSRRRGGGGGQRPPRCSSLHGPGGVKFYTCGNNHLQAHRARGRRQHLQRSGQFTWATVSWETVVSGPPEVIVINDITTRPVSKDLPSSRRTPLPWPRCPPFRTTALFRCCRVFRCSMTGDTEKFARAFHLTASLPV